MVRDGEKPKRVEAACWSVDVVKGARGVRACSLSSIEMTFHEPASAAFTIRSASFSAFGSSVHIVVHIYLSLAFHDNAQCGRLHAPGRETVAYFFPHQTRKIVAE